MRKLLLFLLFLIVGGFLLYTFYFKKKDFVSVLVFSKTEGFRHESIETGQQMFLQLGEDNNVRVDTTEDASMFKENVLKDYNIVVFLNTTGDVLNDAQQLEFNRFIQAGGGFVGIHSAADTEYDWPWYGDLVGAYFLDHPNDPNVLEGTIDKMDSTHICVQHLPDHWTRMDEWYNYKDIRSHIKVLLNLDESSYEGGKNGENHPIAWYHEFDGGRSFYTGMGHTDESFEEADFVQLIWQGVLWAAGDKIPVDFNRSTVAPEENRFQKVVLENNLYEPMELEMLPDGRIIFIERRGKVKLFDPKLDTTTTINHINVFDKLEDGLLGLSIDPDFEKNNWVYCYYAPPNVAYNQLSRFTFNGDSLDTSSEIKVLEVATQRDTCCHSGGSIEFDAQGNLYLSTGDNTNPFESDGFAPIDEREGRKYFDAQRTSANTNDLRGKILRIHPEDDGTYSIPDGNLFPKDGSEGRPEIYVMGCRNPWRIHVDHHTGYLYWGDVGPDAGQDSTNVGPKGHDEVNQARTAGFFGWPLFNGDNKPYFDRDFESGKLPEVAFNPEQPINNSPNNTGIKNLPPAQAAYIWYPYDESKEFPLTETGGRNAMAGPVYYYEDYPDNEQRYPEYYNKKFFAYDWMRDWIMVITQNENGDFERMERFLPNMEFSNISDIIFSPKGDMYFIEYGNAWYKQNEDARLVHLKYISGNRPPVATISCDKTVGKAPLNTLLSAKNSKDYDGDELSYTWFVDGTKAASGMQYEAAFQDAGTYQVELHIADGINDPVITKQAVIVGNEPPSIEWDFAGNKSFFFDNQTLSYAVKVQDDEDGKIGNGIKDDRVVVSIDYLENGYDVTQIELGHQAAEAASQFAVGEDLIKQSDCRACHAINKRIAGPSYEEIADRYKDEPSQLATIAGRIVSGSQGIWGEQLMAAHPQLSQSEAELMVKYILSLSDEASLEKGLAASGKYVFNQHQPDKGAYVLNASYTDNGAKNANPLTAREMLVLRSPLLSSIDYTKTAETMRFDLEAGQYGLEEDLSLMIGNPNAYLMYENIDLTGIAQLEVIATATKLFAQGGSIEFRLDAVDGEKIASIDVESTITPNTNPDPIRTNIVKTEGQHDLYVVFKPLDPEDSKSVAALIYIRFLSEKSL